MAVFRFPAIDLTTLASYEDSTIAWTQDTPPGTSVLVESSIDGEAFASVANGADITQLTLGNSLVGVFVTFRVTLTTTNSSNTPTFSNFTAEVKGEGEPLFSSVDDFYKYGGLRWVTGLNAGLAMEVKSWVGSTRTMELFLPMPYIIAVGDVFTVFRGCDKTLATCIAKFDNVINFGGEPHVPGEDDLFMFPDAGAPAKRKEVEGDNTGDPFVIESGVP